MTTQSDDEATRDPHVLLTDLHDVREWLMDHIDGGEEVRGYDSVLSAYIRTIESAIGALSAEAVAPALPPTPRTNDPTNWNPSGEFDSLTFASYTDAKKAEVLFQRLQRTIESTSRALERLQGIEADQLKAERENAELRRQLAAQSDQRASAQMGEGATLAGAGLAASQASGIEALQNHAHDKKLYPPSRVSGGTAGAENLFVRTKADDLRESAAVGESLDDAAIGSPSPSDRQSDSHPMPDTTVDVCSGCNRAFSLASWRGMVDACEIKPCAMEDQEASAGSALSHSDIVRQLNGALANSMGEDFEIRADFVRAIIAAIQFWRDEAKKSDGNTLRLIADIRYVAGIAERGRGTPLGDGERFTDAVLGYVQILESQLAESRHAHAASDRSCDALILKEAS